MLARIRREFKGKIRYEHRDFPLREVTFRAAEAVRCAGDQGKAQEMSSRIYQNQGRWSRSGSPADMWKKYAGWAKLDVAKWEACMSARTHRAAIETDRRLGLGLGVEATPTIFVGKRKLVGNLPLERLAAEVRAGLSRR